MLKKTINFTLGLAILIGFYVLSFGIVNLTHIKMPPAILGLILFSACLINGTIKEDWVKSTSEFFLKNMAMLFVPFIAGLVVYQSVLLKNWISIILVVFITTLLTIVLTGLFVEYGIKWLRLYRMRRKHD